MSKSVNKVILLGHIGKDAEVKSLPSGVAVANFSLATTERYKDKSGEWQDKTEWHNLVAYKRAAEIIRDYTAKGAKLYVEGRLPRVPGRIRTRVRRCTARRSSSATSPCCPTARMATGTATAREAARNVAVFGTRGAPEAAVHSVATTTTAMVWESTSRKSRSDGYRIRVKNGRSSERPFSFGAGNICDLSTRRVGRDSTRATTILAQLKHRSQQKRSSGVSRTPLVTGRRAQSCRTSISVPIPIASIAC